jgi:hypothetical protein
MPRFLTLLLSSVPVLTPLGCHPKSACHCASDQPRSPFLVCEVEIEILNYDGVHNPEDADYVLSGHHLGGGEQGFSRLLEKLATLPAGTTVQLLPKYGSLLSAGRRPTYYLPFDAKKLNELILTHHLVYRPW